MMNRILLFAAFFCLPLAMQAQTKETNDPKAKALLESIKKKYDSYSSLEAAFRMEIELPNQPKETQGGILSRKGNKYFMKLSSYAAICDGKTVWLIQHANKEIQITNMADANAGELSLSPESILEFYEKGRYLYAITGETTDSKGRKIQEIEFKPMDKSSEYSKLRMAVDKTKVEPVSIKIFAKDGSRFTFWLDKMSPNKAFDASLFTFDKSKYLGYHIEDLR